MLVKIPVLGVMGDIIHRGATSHHLDFIDLGNKTLSLLDFEVRDSLNRPLNLRGGQRQHRVALHKKTAIDKLSL